jgi:hypothetical protein
MPILRQMTLRFDTAFTPPSQMPPLTPYKEAASHIRWSSAAIEATFRQRCLTDDFQLSSSPFMSAASFRFISPDIFFGH